MNQTIQNIILFVKNALIKKHDFVRATVYTSGVQYSHNEEECCGDEGGCCGNCNCG